MIDPLRTIAILGLAGLLSPAALLAEEALRGPVSAAVVEIVDGDTIRVRARIWLGQELAVSVRIRGIDTPENRLAKCAEEKIMSLAAKDRLAELVAGEISLTNITGDKYFGRVDADVTTASGVDLRLAMLASGLARPYYGAAKSDWCGARALPTLTARDS